MSVHKDTYRVIAYLRISRDESKKTESHSIKNQRALINDYISTKKDLLLCGEIVDDGYSGVHFDRPGFKELLAHISNGNIDGIIVKDLSRFGRDHIETGRFIEQIFPEIGLRFIAITDNYDSLKQNSMTDYITIPFKNIINDAYCYDISKKAKSQLDLKRKMGQFIGSFSPYGYLKDPLHKNRLIPDPYASRIVKYIFALKISGYSHARIARSLNDGLVLAPAKYKRYSGNHFMSGFESAMQNGWSVTSVLHILKNEVYLGHMLAGKRLTPHYKSKKQITVNKNKWIIVNNTHTPIIKKECFSLVQNLLLKDERTSPNKDKLYILSGLLECGTCNGNMVRKSMRKNNKEYIYYVCANNKDKRLCSSHSIPALALEDAVSLLIKKHIQILSDEESLTQKHLKEQEQDIMSTYERQYNLWKNELAQMTTVYENLYEHFTEGLIPCTDYLLLKDSYRQKIDALQKMIRVITNARISSDNIKKSLPFLSEQFLPDRATVVSMVDKIKIFEKGGIHVFFKFPMTYEQSKS